MSSEGLQSPRLLDIEQVRADYQRWDEYYQTESDGGTIATQIDAHIMHWFRKEMTPELSNHFAFVVLPRLVTKIAKTRYFAIDIPPRIMAMFRSALLVVIKSMEQNNLALAEMTREIFNSDASFYSNNRTMPDVLKFAIERPQDEWARARNVSWGNSNEWLADVTNYFGVQNGFNLILKHISSESCPLAIAVVYLGMFHNLIQEHYFVPNKTTDIGNFLFEQFVPKMKALPINDVKKARKEDFDAIFRYLQSILKSVIEPSQAAELIETLGLSIAKQLLTSGVLDKRLYAINYLAATIEQVKISEYHRDHHMSMLDREIGIDLPVVSRVHSKWVTSEYLCKWLKDNEFLQHVFGPTRHVQLLRKSVPVIQFLALNLALSDEDLTLIWNCATKTHESLAQETLNTIADAAGSLLTAHIDLLIKHILDTDYPEMPSRLLQFIAQLAQNVHDSKQKCKLLDILWEILSDPQVSIENGRHALQLLEDQLKSDVFVFARGLWIRSLVKIIQSKDYDVKGMACKLLRGIVFSLPASKSHFKTVDRQLSLKIRPSDHYDYDNIPEMVFALESHDQFTTLLLDEVDNYLMSAKAGAPEALLASRSDQLRTTSILGRLPHDEEIKTRLDLLFQMHSYSPYQMSDESAFRLWDVLTTNGLTTFEENEAYTWFIGGRTPVAHQSGNTVGDEYCLTFFQKRVSQVSPATLSSNGLNCFQRYFIDSNAIEKRLRTIELNNNQIDYELLDDAPDLYGYAELWNIVLDAKDQRVVDSAMEFLFRLHERLSEVYKMHKTRLHARETCISEIMVRLTHASSLLKEGTENTTISNARRHILRCLNMLTRVMDGTESASNKQATITRGYPVSLRVAAHLTTSTNELAKITFSLDTDSNMHFRKLREVVIAKLHRALEEHDIHSDDLVFMNFASQNTALDVNDEPTMNRSLAQLGILDQGKVLVRNLPSTKGRESFHKLRTKLAQQLDEKVPADAHQKAQEVSEICGLSKELALFALRKAAWDVYRTVDQLMDPGKKAEIVNEAKKAGVSENQASQSNDHEIQRIMTARTSSILDSNADSNQSVDVTLPSSILSNSSRHFDHLFQLLDLNDDQVAELAWGLICRLPTSQHIKEQLVGGKDGANVVANWENALSSDTYKLLYALQIVDQIVFPFDDEQYVDRRIQWATWFLSSGGLSRLVAVMQKFDITASNSASPLSLQHKRDCIGLALKVMDEFLGACASSATESSGTTVFRQRLRAVVHSIPDTLVNANEVAEKSIQILEWARANKVNAGQLVCYAWRVLVSVTSVLSVSTTPEGFVSKVIHLTKYLLIDEDADVRLHTARQVSRLAKEPAFESELLNELLAIQPDTLVSDPIVWKGADQLYWLLNRLVRFDLNKHKLNDDIEDLEALYASHLLQLIDDVQRRPVVEVNASSTPDYVLVGQMNLLSTIAKYWPQELEQADLIDNIFRQCLFAVKATRSPLPKCKTAESRAAAYKLLLILSRNSSANFSLVLSLVAANHSAPYQALNTWEYFVGSEDRSAAGYVGINNLGATCYMNSLFQQWYMMPSLRASLLSANVTAGGASNLHENLLFQLQQLFGYLQESEKMSYNPRDFCNSFKDLEGAPTNPAIQQDVNEFFNLLCQRVETQLKGTADEKIFTKEFVGVLANETRTVDPSFPYRSERDEEFYTIPLDVKNKSSLEDAMHLFVKPEMLEGDNMIEIDKYNRKIDATRRSLLKKLSRTCIFHLKRFDYDLQTGMKKKLNSYFTYPMSLNLKPWTMEGIAEQEGRNEEAKFRPDNYYEYQLVGILIHTGSADSGHYYSIIKERTAPYRWLQFNDRMVSEFDPIHIASESFGGVRSTVEWDNYLQKHVTKEISIERNAYMLVYERISEEGLEGIDEAEEAAEAKSAMNPSTDVAIGVPNVLDALVLQAQQTNDVALPIASAPVLSSASQAAGVQTTTEQIDGVPKNIHELVWAENSQYLRDRAIFDSAYFTFLLQFVSSVKFEPVLAFSDKFAGDAYNDNAAACTDRQMIMIKLVTRVVLELISHAKANLSLPWWMSQLTSMMSKHVPACVWFVDYCRRNNVFKEMFLLCPSERTRIAFLDLCTAVLKNLVEYQVAYRPSAAKRGQSAAHDMSSFVDLLNVKVEDASLVMFHLAWDILEDSRTNWRRFKQFFGFIRNYALLGWKQRQHLLDVDIISVYEDYFMGKSHAYLPNRPRVMDDHHLPDLTEFIDTLVIVVRGCSTEAAPNAPPAPTAITDKVLELPPHSRKILADQSFFGSLVEMDYNTPAVTDLCRHLSWYAPERSDIITEIVVSQFEKGPSVKFGVFEYILENLLALNDDLQERRIRRSMTTFKMQSLLSNHSYSKIKGLLAVAQDLHERRDTHALDLVRFVAKCCYTNPAVRDFILRRAGDLQWIVEFLDAKFEEEEPTIRLSPEVIRSDAEAGLVLQLIPLNRAATFPEHITSSLPNWKATGLYSSLVFFHALSQDKPKSLINDDLLLQQQEKINELTKQLSEATRDRDLLLEIAEYFVTVVPESQVPINIQKKLAGVVLPGIQESAWYPGRASDRALRNVELNDLAAVAQHQRAGVGETSQVTSARQMETGWIEHPDGGLASVALPVPAQRPTSVLDGENLTNVNLSGSTDAMRGGGVSSPTGDDSEDDHESSGWIDDDMGSSHFETLDRRARDERARRADSVGNTQALVPLGGIVVPQLPIRSVTVDPSDLDSKVAELQMIFGDLSADVLVVALRHNRYDLDQTANDLFDDMRKDMYKRMASSAAEQSSANRKSNTDIGRGGLGMSDDDMPSLIPNEVSASQHRHNNSDDDVENQFIL